jgi:hypothetical protein
MRYGETHRIGYAGELGPTILRVLCEWHGAEIDQRSGRGSHLHARHSFKFESFVGDTPGVSADTFFDNRSCSGERSQSNF